MYAGWHGEAARPDLQAHQNSHWSRGNSSESICAWSWLQNNYFAISPMAVPVFPSSQSRWGMSGELRPLEWGVCTPELVPNNEFMPRYPFQNFQILVQRKRRRLSGQVSVPAKPASIMRLIILPWKNKNYFGCRRNVPYEQQEANPGALTCLLHWLILNWGSQQKQREFTCTQTLCFMEPFCLQSSGIWESRGSLKAPNEGKYFYGETPRCRQIRTRKNQSSGGFYATVAKTLKENIVKGLYFLLFFGGTISAGVAYILRPECSQINCFASSSLPPPSFLSLSLA